MATVSPQWRTRARNHAYRVRAIEIAIALGLVAFVWWRAEELSMRGAVALQTPPVEGEAAQALRDAIPAVARTWMLDHAARELGFKWGEGVLMLGLERARHVISDALAREQVDRYESVYYAADDARAAALTWSDEVTPALAAVERAARGDEVSERIARGAVDYVMSAPRTQPRGLIQHFGHSWLRHLSPPMPEAWVDSVFHIAPLLVRYGELMHDPRYLEEAAHQTLGFLRALQDPRTGLLTHAFNDGKVGEPVPAFDERMFWARGQAWMLASGVYVLHALAPSHPSRAEIAARIAKLEAALRYRQAPSGLFHTLVLRDDTYEETAGSALILYAMARGVRLGLFGKATRDSVTRGARGLYSVLQREGERVEVTGTSLGTNPVPAIYAFIPTASQVSYGVGAWLLAASEIVSLKP